MDCFASESRHHERAFSLGIIPTVVQMITSQLAQDGFPKMTPVLNSFLEWASCHEFTEFGGLHLLLAALAKKKDSNTFQSLCNIASNSEVLHRAMTFLPAMSAQIAIVLMKGPENCQEQCIQLAFLFAQAGIALHSSVISALLSFLKYNCKTKARRRKRRTRRNLRIQSPMKGRSPPQQPMK